MHARSTPLTGKPEAIDAGIAVLDVSGFEVALAHLRVPETV